MRFIVFTIVFSFANTIFAQTFIEPCKFGQPLINAIQSTYTPSQTLGYGPARDILYSTIDNRGQDLHGIYTDFKVTLDPAADPSVSAYQNGSGINAEHVYPQSKGAGSEPMRSDLHNIYPSKVSVNSARGSCPFSEIADSQTDKWYYLSTQTSSIPSASEIDNYSEKEDNACLFEPRESVKGDIARAVFYFYAIYQSQANSADASFFNGQKNTLLQWHYADPVDSIENVRNQKIASHQGNLNPFSVDSTLAYRAFFMADASYPDGDVNCYDVIQTSTHDLQLDHEVKLISNFVDTQLVLESKIQGGEVTVFSISGEALIKTDLKSNLVIDVTRLVSGLYFVQVVTEEGRTKTFKVVKYRN